MVDNEATGKKLLSNGQLQSRVTIVPLNKVSGRPMDRRVVDFAQNLVGAENVKPALSLIEFPEEVRLVSQYQYRDFLLYFIDRFSVLKAKNLVIPRKILR